MANINQAPSFMSELGSLSLYKRNQGKLTRQLTLVAIIGVTLCGCYSLYQSWLLDADRPIQIGVPVAIAAVLSWLGFRAVNYAPFAEFLIAVQAEVSKVNWPSWTELKRATIVVVCTMAFLGFILFVYDIVWFWLLSLFGVLNLQ
jgi:preprotein translocase subunit SecE